MRCNGHHINPPKLHWRKNLRTVKAHQSVHMPLTCKVRLIDNRCCTCSILDRARTCKFQKCKHKNGVCTSLLVLHKRSCILGRVPTGGIVRAHFADLGMHLGERTKNPRMSSTWILVPSQKIDGWTHTSIPLVAKTRQLACNRERRVS